MPSIVAARTTVGPAPQEYANLAAQYFAKVYTSLPNDVQQIPRAIAKSKTNANIKLTPLLEKLKNYMQGALHFENNTELAEVMNELVESDAYKLLEGAAPYQLTTKGRKDKFGPKVVIAEALLEVMAAYKKMVTLAKPALETVKSSLKDVQPASKRVLRQALERDKNIDLANEALQAAGIKEFKLDSDYLALLARIENDKEAALKPGRYSADWIYSKVLANADGILAKDKKTIAKLTEYAENEQVALQRLKTNKLAKQAYNYYKKLALGAEKIRRNALAEKMYLEGYNDALIKANNLDFEYELLGQYPIQFIE